MEAIKKQGIPGDLDEYICGYIDQTLSPDERRTLSAYLKRNPEACAYFEKAVKGSKLAASLPERKASYNLESRLALSLSRERVRRLSG